MTVSVPDYPLRVFLHEMFTSILHHVKYLILYYCLKSGDFIQDIVFPLLVLLETVFHMPKDILFVSGWSV